ncbi:uncharacterized protein K02A2.6-like [Lucilia cuprina]|uniref:uncharacterized protein K02A2.6-like n=1 Tax=Lucilia cuprina TaxID=7375 RepID=UPI001F0572BA|nr:uncharacterized protein K02A2.6-like [Lucilia cuprina]
MVYGRKFLLRTDHKQLLAIFGSRKGIPVHSASRLQRWALTMMTYNFDIEYVKTDDFGNVDMLSRLLPSMQPEDEDFVIACATLEYNIKSILKDNLQSIPLTHQMVLQATEKDATIQAVLHHIQSSWPRKSKDLSSNDLLPFFNRRSSLSVVDGCLLFGERIVIPQVFRNRVLRILHKGHQGQKRMKSIARSNVYWSNIDQQIEEFVRLCPHCQTNTKSPAKTPLCSWPISTKPL